MLQALQAQLERVLYTPITFTLGGPLPPPPAVVPVPAAPPPPGPAVGGRPVAAAAAAATNATDATDATDAAGPPTLTALARVFTVKDAWREWQEGLAGRPALRELEARWGSRWRPGNAIRIAFSRRKVIWDEILARIARGKSVDEVVAELELLRASRSLSSLVEDLKRRREHVPRTPVQGQGAVRGQLRRGRYGRWGRRGGPLPRQAVDRG